VQPFGRSPRGPRLRPHPRPRQRCHSERSSCQRSNGPKAARSLSDSGRRSTRLRPPEPDDSTHHRFISPRPSAPAARERNDICHRPGSQHPEEALPPGTPHPQTPPETSLAARTDGGRREGILFLAPSSVNAPGEVFSEVSPSNLS
jgi:hypothetical protein